MEEEKYLKYENFLKELIELFKKYNAEIYVKGMGLKGYIELWLNDAETKIPFPIGEPYIKQKHFEILPQTLRRIKKVKDLNLIRDYGYEGAKEVITAIPETYKRSRRYVDEAEFDNRIRRVQTKKEREAHED